MSTLPPVGPAEDQAATKGPAGQEIEGLLAASQREGVAVLGTIVKAALRRAVNGGRLKEAETLFTPEERAKLADAIAATNATAELMGRARIQAKAAKARGV